MTRKSEILSRTQSRSVIINGITFKSAKDAAVKLGLSYEQLRNRIRSTSSKWKDYKFAEPQKQRHYFVRVYTDIDRGIYDEYDSISACAKDLGLSTTTIDNRIKSPNFPEFQRGNFKKGSRDRQVAKKRK